MQSAAHTYLSGSLAASVTALLFQPLDVIKTIMIGSSHKSFTASSSSSAAKTMTFTDATRWIVGQEGYRALWKGSMPSLLRVAPGSGLYFANIHILTQFWQANVNQGRRLSAVETGFIGFSARAAVCALTSPFSVIKTRLEYQSGKTMYTGTLDALRQIVRTESSRALFAGLIPTIARDAPFSGIYLATYKTLQRKLQERGVSSTTVHAAVAGTTAGVVATLLTHPADVLKTRIQLWAHDGTKFSLRRGLQTVWSEHGWRGLFRGAWPRVLKRSASAAVTWTLFEHMMERWK